MTRRNLVRISGGGDEARFPGLETYQLSATESQLLADGLRRFQVFTDGQFPQDVARQSLLAQIAADRLLTSATPGLGRLIEKARADQVDCIFVSNLPAEKSVTALLSLTLSSAIGKVFNYGLENGGELGMEVRSDRSGAENPRAELDWHTEGVWVPRECRAEWIFLLGIDSTPGIYTAYAPIRPVEQKLSPRARAWLYSQSVCFRKPHGSASNEPTWSIPRAVLSRSPLGHTEIVWPGFAVRAARLDDTAYANALTELATEINRQHVQVSFDAGCLLAFNNCRGVHMHAPASDGYRVFLKTYARHSLRMLQHITKEAGPIFAI